MPLHAKRIRRHALTRRSLWNSVWLGTKPAVQFLAGAWLLRSRPEVAGDFYTLLLLWSAGYELAVLLADRNVVAIAYRRGRPVIDAIRGLLPAMLLFGLVLSVVIALAGTLFTGSELTTSIAMAMLGTISGIAEAALWCQCAEKGRFSLLAAVRTVSTIVFGLSLIAVAEGNLNIAVAIALETGVIALAFGALVVPTAVRAIPLQPGAKTVFGFWLVKVVSYLNRFIESWWAVATLSGAALASLRVGLAPKAFLMMGFTSLLQPTLFQVSHDSWRSERESKQGEACAAAEALVLLASIGTAALCLVHWLFADRLKPYSDALVVTWITLSVFTGPGSFGMLASSLLTNYGYIRVVLMNTISGLALRSVLYAVLLLLDKLNIAVLALVGEIVTAVAQNSFWITALQAKLWSLKRRDVLRVIGRSCLSLGALAFLLADNTLRTGVLILGASQLVVAVDAASEMRRALHASR